MKNFSLQIIFFIFLSKAGFAQCTPFAATNVAGFCPPASSFPCIVRGEPFSEVIRFENWDTVGGIVISECRFDSITSLPNGISYSFYPDNRFSSGEIGCIILNGMTNDSVQWDTMKIHVTVSLLGLGSFSGELSRICEDIITLTILDTSNLVLCSYGYYYLRIINAGDTCPIDSICPQLHAGIEERTEIISEYPNPASEYFNITLSRYLDNLDLQVMDISGRIVKTLNNLSGDRINLFMKDSQSGIYFYRITSNSKLISTGKLIVKD